MSDSLHIAVLGGGASGFFAALSCAHHHPDASVSLIERSANLLAKVKISGGGRCNVTHACFDPAKLVTFYPRGGQALRGPFSRFQPKDTVAWFESRGVALKTEEDGRMFPVSDKSQSIIDCLMTQAKESHITIMTDVLIDAVRAQEKGFSLLKRSGEVIMADRVILASGSSVSGWDWAKHFGHTIETPVPSLFTFTIQDPRLEGLAGVSVPKATVSLPGTPLSQSGPLLITHWGLSGPAALKLSAWGARALAERHYNADISVNWLPGLSEDQVLNTLRQHRTIQSKKAVSGDNPFPLPRRLWERLVITAGITDRMHWAEVSNGKILDLAKHLRAGLYRMTGKSPFKDEFVTCGGIRLDEVDFRTMQSKKVPGLYFAGEILDIDAVTGGFNFQNAWTTGWIAGRAAGELRAPVQESAW